MNIKYLLLATVLTTSASAINVTLSGTAGVPGSLNDAIGDPTDIGSLGLIIIDTDGDGIVVSAGSYVVGTYLDGSDDYVAYAGEVVDVFGSRVFEFSSISANDPGLAQGDAYYALWFPTLTISDDTFSAGLSYGMTTRTDVGSEWVLPADSGSVSASSAPGGNADLTVVPEPEAYALIAGVLGLGLAMIRRRR